MPALPSPRVTRGSLREGDWRSGRWHLLMWSRVLLVLRPFGVCVGPTWAPRVAARGRGLARASLARGPPRRAQSCGQAGPSAGTCPPAPTVLGAPPSVPNPTSSAGAAPATSSSLCCPLFLLNKDFRFRDHSALVRPPAPYVPFLGCQAGGASRPTRPCWSLRPHVTRLPRPHIALLGCDAEVQE